MLGDRLEGNFDRDAKLAITFDKLVQVCELVFDRYCSEDGSFDEALEGVLVQTLESLYATREVPS